MSQAKAKDPRKTGPKDYWAMYHKVQEMEEFLQKSLKSLDNLPDDLKRRLEKLERKVGGLVGRW